MQRKLLLIFSTILAASGFVHAQIFPQAPIKIIVPAAPGSPTDVIARFVGIALARDIKGPVVVENKVGANGIVGTGLAANAAPDGHTLLAAPSNFYINKALYAKLPYDPIADFKPIAKVAAGYMALVVPASSSYHSVKELTEHMRAHPGKLAYASAGNGSVTHLAPAMLFSRAGVQGVHIPYKGADSAITDTISGQVAMSFTSLAISAPLVQSGKLRALAVTGPNRSQALPLVPTLAEVGYAGFDMASGVGFMAPKDIRPEIAGKLSSLIATICQSSEFESFAKVQGLEVECKGAEAYAAAGPAEMERWAKAIAASGARVE